LDVRQITGRSVFPVGKFIVCDVIKFISNATPSGVDACNGRMPGRLAICKSEEASMLASTLLRLTAIMMATTIAASAALPAWAASDALFNQAAPRWFDQTVYRPNCPSIECDCGCRCDGFRDPDCGRW
jgi:hypothetical protein